ncbi:hypothetical protein POX_e06309 [Penicillium oxalicum]|nr:hypothetical protein POX_e06309 [Penicillium oxalicum]KAI2788295.1 hypothetical protein POX_e06309 [Penicillium oxalicum]
MPGSSLMRIPASIMGPDMRYQPSTKLGGSKAR